MAVLKRPNPRFPRMLDSVGVVGKHDSSSEVSELLEALAPVRTSEDPPLRRYVGSPQKGMDLVFENERVIAVQIYTQATRTFSQFLDELPFELKIAMSQAAIHQVLGPPVESSNISSKYEFAGSGLKVVISYDASTIMRLISISMLGK
jgi:hypothetical protein